MPISPNTRLGRYTIFDLIGAGGMGEVYLAEDTHLRRLVAVKFLTPEYAQYPERLRRFEREAHAASGLNHPNILTIHEICEHEGHRFIVSEYVEGESLRQRLRRGRMGLEEALDTAIQVASALSAAHRAGVVHRDIKPENIMVRGDGLVKVLDFGLAKLVTEEPPKATVPADRNASTCTLNTTSPGIFLGTVAYMSPEQLREAEVDARTDIWSAGVVLYEMTAGRKPFDGETPSDIIAAILRTEPPMLAQSAHGLPAALEHITGKALAKDREARYRDCEELLGDLKELRRELDFASEPGLRAGWSRGSAPPPAGEGDAPPVAVPPASRAAAGRFRARAFALRPPGGTRSPLTRALLFLMALAVVLGVASFVRYAPPAQAITSIAVLPFTNGSGDQSIDYLSEGMSESLIDSLSQLPHMKVIARGSSFKYKGAEINPQEVAQSLGVEALVMGRIAQKGEDIQLRVELVDVRSERQVWSAQYNYKGAEVHHIQSELSRAIGDELRVKLSAEEQKRLNERNANNGEAYRLYLKGRYHWNKLTQEDLKKSLVYFQEAIDKDPEYALAYTGLANSYITLGANYLPTKETYPKASFFARKALELDGNLAEAHYATAVTSYLHEWDLPGAEKALNRTLELNRNYAAAYSLLSHLRLTNGETATALPLIKKALDLDPLSLLFNANLGYAYYYARQYKHALTQIKRALELEPGAGFLYSDMCKVYAQMGSYDDALAACQKSIILQGKEPGALSSLGVAYALAGKQAEAEWVVETLRGVEKERYVQPYHTAAIYAALGQKDKAIEWLERASREGSSMMNKIKVDPSLDKVRSDPRFEHLLRSMQLL